MTVISTEALTMRYPSVTALDALTLTVGPGVTGLVGANGAGKSTLIKILLGLLPATSGAARVLDLDVVTAGERIRRRVGYMPEHDCLPPDVTATELVVHLGRMSGLPTTVARERAADTLRHVGLYEERYREIGGYSTGMRQRVKLAQALVHDPELVLLDEPTNGLDPAGRDEMLRLISRIGTDFGISVLVTSHLLGGARTGERPRGGRRCRSADPLDLDGSGHGRLRGGHRRGDRRRRRPCRAADRRRLAGRRRDPPIRARRDATTTTPCSTRSGTSSRTSASACSGSSRVATGWPRSSPTHRVR